MLRYSLFSLAILVPFSLAKSFHDNPEQDQDSPYNHIHAHEDSSWLGPSPLSYNPDEDIGWTQQETDAKWGTDQWPFVGISTFAHLPYTRCLARSEEAFDIAIIGAPFDTAVTYRPGARFGPRAIRAASARQNPLRAYNHRAGINPYVQGLKVLDCGDIPVSPFDNALALRQMSAAFLQLGSRTPASISAGVNAPRFTHPKLLILGGDHAIALASLRALRKIHDRPITVIHFDAHLDTWHPNKYPSAWKSSGLSFFNHGSMFFLANQEGLLSNRSVHAGLRTRLDDLSDWDDDDSQGWLRISADDIDELKPAGVVERILERVGDEPVYLSLDIDVIDPGLAPGTGTPEPGGWTSREVIRILRGLENVNLVGADVVEVAPAYDGTGEQTALVAAQVVYEVLTSMVKKAVKEAKGVAAGHSKIQDVKDEL